MRVHSPLRYPGGKAALTEFLSAVIRLNGLEGGVYIEPFAGGAGAALSLLSREYVRRIILNDIDPCLIQLWRSILNEPNKLARRVRDVHLSVGLWRRQRQIYRRNLH